MPDRMRWQRIEQELRHRAFYGRWRQAPFVARGKGPPSVCTPEGIYCECRMVPICQRPSCCLVSLCVLITAIEVQAMVEQLRRFTAQLSKGYLRAGHLSKRERASSHSIRHVFAFVYPKKVQNQRWLSLLQSLYTYGDFPK